MATFQPEGVIKLIRNVDIDVSYTHQYYFETIESQQNFFDGKVFKTLTNGTYQRKNINTIQVPYQADEIADCKYLYWSNPQYSDKRYYAFVTSIDYINPGVSQINYQLDSYQTFLFDMQWKKSFIEREHTQRFWENGLPVTNTLDEGLDYGSNYDTFESIELTQFTGDGGETYISFMIFGTTANIGGGYSVGNIPSGINYFFVPVSTISKYANFRVGSTILTNASGILDAFRTDTKLVNSLVSCIVAPFISLSNFNITKNEGGYFSVTGNSVETKVIRGNSTTLNVLQLSDNNYWRSIVKSISKYDAFPPYTESKLYMYPYSFIELTTNRGDSHIVKLEYVSGEDLEISIMSVLNYQNKMIAYINNSLLTNGYSAVQEALIDNSNENMPIVDDYTASYLQSNSNALEVAKSNAQMLHHTQLENAQRTYNTNQSNLVTNMATGGLQSLIDIVGGFGLGNPSAMLGGINKGIDAFGNYVTGVNSNETNYTNKSKSANTDYQMSVASTMAKVRDAEQVPPSTRSLGSNYLFDNIIASGKLYLYKKTITTEYASKLTAYFKQYGYKVNSLSYPYFHTRASWNYIKMKEPNIYGNIPMDELMKLRDIFLKGITLWHGDYIGDYNRNNDEI